MAPRAGIQTVFGAFLLLLAQTRSRGGSPDRTASGGN